MNSSSNKLIETYRTLIHEAHRKVSKRATLIPVLAVVAFLIGSWGIFSLIEHRFFLEPLAKIILWAILIGGSAGIFIQLRQKLQTGSSSDFYKAFCNDQNLKSLRDALDLYENPRNQTTAFTEKAIAQNLSHLDEKKVSGSLSSYLQKHSTTDWLKLSSGSFLGGLLIFLVSLFATDGSSQRLLAFWQDFDRPNPFTYTITPGNETKEQGATFRVEVQFEGSQMPGQVSLALKTDIESDYRTRRMRLSDDNTWVSDGIELFNNLTYYLHMDEFRTPSYDIQVQLIPRFQELLVEVSPPEYTRLESTTSTYPFSRIEAYKGSEITIKGTVNKKLDDVIAIRHRSDDSLTFNQSDRIWETSFTVMQADSLTFTLLDNYSLLNRNPFTFRIATLEDHVPFVRILQPEREMSGMNIDSVQITYDLEDDFGFTSVRLRYELLKAFTETPQTGTINLRTPRERTGIFRYTWYLRPLNLSSMDELTYWIEATDNDAVSGFKTGTSERQIIRIQSLADYLFEQDEREQEIARNMDDAQDRMARMQETYERLRNQVRDTPNERWEQSQTIEDIEEQRSDLEEQVQKLQEQFEELQREMEQDSGLSEETMERYKELQRLMEEIDDPDIMRMLEEMRENLENMSQQQLREALDNLEFNEERYRERLERTVELFKQLKLNSDLDKASRLLDELEKREEMLQNAESYGEQEIEQQKQIQQELEDLAKKLDELPENSPRRQQERMEELNQQLQDMIQDAQSEIGDNIEQMEQGGQNEQIQQQQQQIREKMQEMSSMIQASREQMNQDQVTVNILALKNILQSVIQLSEEQEDILIQTSGLRDQSAAFVDLARRQRNIYVNFGAVIDTLNQVSREIPQFTSRILTRQAEVERQMDRGVNNMRERQRNNSTVAARFSMAGLNEIGTMLADLIDQLQQQQGGDGSCGGMSAQQMMQQMQDMSGQQQQLNQQIQDMINDMAGERLTQDNIERLDQLARQQNQIREQLRNIQRSGAFESGDSVLSELERLAEEMEDAINDLRGGATDPLMVRRQQNILSRMLEAEKSLQEREEEDDRREGTTPDDFDISRAPELTMEELEQRIRSGLQDPNQTRFTEDYQRLIERYFELLREMNRTVEESESR